MSFSGQWRTNMSNVMQGQMPMGTFHQGSGQQIFMPPGAPQQPDMSHFGHGPIFPGTPATISYPQPRSTNLNAVAFQQTAAPGVGSQSQHCNSVGTITKFNNDCGLVNDEVFFYRNVCKGPVPKLGDRVVFDATVATSGQFKWNATRVQMMPPQSMQPAPLLGSNGSKNSGYGSVAPPDYQRSGPVRHNSPRRSSPPRERYSRSERDRIDRGRERIHRSRDRDEDEHDRKRRREDHERANASINRDRDRERERERNEREREREREREKERERERNEREREREKDRRRERERETDKSRVERSPHRAIVKGRRNRAIRRYVVQIPKSVLTLKRASIQDLRHRYPTLYIPSDFFHANIKWSEVFTPESPFTLTRPCQFHIMHRIVEPPYEQTLDDIEPPDADYRYSAKVMLMAAPPIADIYKMCFEDDDSETEQCVHPSRLISFLTGTRKRNEPMAIGGPWSATMDGPDPDKDPAVLIRTAIRTCKALTGIDLSNCTQWYRFMELHYHRNEYKTKENKESPSRVETVVIYLPDIHSCMPSSSDWPATVEFYKTAGENAIVRRSAAAKSETANADEGNNSNSNNNDSEANEEAETPMAADVDEGENGGGDESTAKAANNTDVDGHPAEDDCTIIDKNVMPEEKSTNATAAVTAADAADDDDQSGTAESNDVSATSADKTSERPPPAIRPTHYSELDLKSMKVPEIRNELIARNLSSKGVRNILMARLAKAINQEKVDERITRSPQPTIADKADDASRDANEMAIEDDADGTEMEHPPTETDEKKRDAKAEQEEDNEEEEEEENTNDNDEHDGWGGADMDMNDIVILDEYDASKNADDAPREMDDKEKAQLTRRYTLPGSPGIIVHPNRLYKEGKFDCSVMSLAVLLDYRQEDAKERSFEVSLFAELFNEMLARDFGFNIYKELYVHKGPTAGGNDEENHKDADNSAGKKDEAPVSGGTATGATAAAATGSSEGEDKAKESGGSKTNACPDASSNDKSPRERRSSKRGNEDDGQEDDNHSVVSSDRKRRATSKVVAGSKDKTSSASIVASGDKKTVVVKPHLLLSFLYFDSTHCGYIFEKDLEDLFGVLGLSLSRGQIRKVLGKFHSRQAFYYRKLTDKEETKDSIPSIEDTADEIPADELKRIALGNRLYAENCSTGENDSSTTAIALTLNNSHDDEGLVHYNGAVVHVGKLMEQIRRTEKNYSDLDKLYNDLRRQHTDLQKDHTKSNIKIKDLQSDVKSLTRKLSDADQDLFNLNRKYKDQHSALSYIYSRVEPFFSREKDKEKEKEKDKDKDRDHKSEGSRDKDKDKDKEKDSDKSRDKDKDKDKDAEKSKDRDRDIKDKKKDKDDDKDKIKKITPKIESSADKVKTECSSNMQKTPIVTDSAIKTEPEKKSGKQEP